MATRESRKRASRMATSMGKLADLRKNKGAGALDLDDDNDIYQEVSEAQYRQMVQDRRDGDEFVVDDDGLGYYDDGEEHLFDVDESLEARRAREAKRNAGALSMEALERNRRLDAQKKGEVKKVSSLFLGKGAATVGPGSMKEKASDMADDGFLEGALGDLDAEDEVAEAAASKRRRTAQRRQARARTTRTRAGGRKGNMRKLQDIALFAGDAIAEAEKATVKHEAGAAFDDDAFDGAGEDALAGDNAPVGGALSTPAPVAKQQGATTSTKARARAEAKAALFASATSAPVKAEPTRKSAALAAQRSVQQTGAVAAPATAASAPSAAAAAGTDMGQASTGGLYAAVQGSGEAMSVLGDATGAAGAMLEPSRDEQGRYVDAFWFDAYEEPRAPGTVFLFCKVRDPSAQGQWRSLCVVVPNLERELYFLPRRVRDEKTGEEKPVPTLEVYAEVKEILRKHCGNGRSEFGAKPVKLNYAFEEPDVPREPTDYLKVVLSPTARPLDPRLTGRTFSRVFGTHAPCLENFLLGRDLMGPCWLRIRDPQLQPTALSWCAFEVKVAGAGSLVKMDQGPDASPPLRTMSFSLKTVVHPRTQAHEVVVASLLLHEAVAADGPTQRKTPSQHMTLMRPLSNGNASIMRLALPNALERNKALNVRVCANEQELLGQLLQAVHASDPDVLVGHNMLGFDMDVLLNRMRCLRVPHWSKIGRLRRREMPRAVAGAGGKDSFVGVLTCGRLLCDTYLAARELVRQTIYTLTALAKELLGHARVEVEPAQVPSFTSDAASLVKLAQHTENDAFLALQLMFKLEVMPLTKQITNLAGNLWARTLKGARAERIEFLLLHEFKRLGYLLPDKLPDRVKNAGKDGKDGKGKGKKGKGRRKPAYTGGLVLEPKRGLYDTSILLLDFNSLYPSIIQEYNICFTTVDRELRGIDGPVKKEGDAGAAAAEGEEAADEPDAEEETKVPELPDPAVHADMGVLPRVIRRLVQRRRQVKQLIKSERDANVKQQLDIRQKALKILANSMYGCLGFSNSRFFAKPIAALVTQQGRDILHRTVEMADAMGYDVVYGDTDSIMINTGVTDLAEVKQIGNKVKREVNKLYKLLEIDIDGIYKSMLLLKKKKYAALAAVEKADGTVVYEKEAKGLDLVRRDWCILSREAGHKVLDFILSGQARDDIVSDIHSFIGQLATDIRAGSLALEKFVITKGLNKAPHEYPDVNAQPHLRVALAMMKAGKPVNTGDHIPYVVCEGEGSAAERAYHPDEVRRSNGALLVDVEWYLTQQLLPPISRLCEPIEGTSSAALAEQMGLDPSKFASSAHKEEADQIEYTASCYLEAKDRFRNVEKLEVKCGSCAHKFALESLFQFETGDPRGRISIKCPQCDDLIDSSRLRNMLQLRLREHVRKFASSRMVCTDPMCGHTTRCMPVVGPTCPMSGCNSRLRPEYSDSDLYLQIMFYKSLFDLTAARNQLERENERRRMSEPPQPEKTVPMIGRAKADKNHDADPVAEALHELHTCVERVLEESAYHHVDTGSIFLGVMREQRPANL